MLSKRPPVDGHDAYLLKTLGFRDASRSVAVWLRDASTRDRIYELRHRVEVVPLTSTSLHLAQRSKLSIVSIYECSSREEGMRERYSVPGYDLQGEVVTLASGEAIRAEQGRGVYSVHWTSALPAGDIVEEIVDQFVDTTRKSALALFKGRGRVSGDWDTVVEAIQNRPRGVQLFRFDGDGWSATWKSTVGELEGYPLNMHEVGVVGRKFQPFFLGRLAVATATAEVGSTSTALFKSFSPLLGQYR